MNRLIRDVSAKVALAAVREHEEWLKEVVCPHCGIGDRELNDAEIDACPSPDSDDPKITRAEYERRHREPRG